MAGFCYTGIMTEVFLVTSNANKLREWQGIMPPHITLSGSTINLPELQSDDLEEIVKDKAERAFAEIGQPVVVEDIAAGLIKHGGLPGPFIKFYLNQLGKDALYQLAGREDEPATVSCSISYYDGERHISARVDASGRVVKPRVDLETAFGFDSTFVPDGHDLTYAEMSSEEKNAISHRGRAIRLFIEKLGEAGI